VSAEERIAAIARNTAGTMVEALGIRVTALGDGTASGEMEYREDLRQSGGLFHAGAILALADSIATSAAMTVVSPEGEFDQSRFPLAIQTSSNIVGNVNGGKLVAMADTVHRGRTTIVVETKVRGDDGKLIATTSTTLLVPSR
jgi:1,4-dihydroxy-2-naphthoyl-CoA hydrolase